MVLSPILIQIGLRSYLLAKGKFDSNVRYRALAISHGRVLDIPVLKVMEGKTLYLATEFPSTLPDARIEISERHTDKNLINVAAAEAAKNEKVNRRILKNVKLNEMLVSLDEQNPLSRGQYDLNLVGFFDSSDGESIWRIAVDWKGTWKSVPQLTLINAAGEEVKTEFNTFECQRGNLYGIKNGNRKVVSFRIPSSLQNFSLFARDPQREVISNFYPMDTYAVNALKSERKSIMQSADDQSAYYEIWLSQHLKELEDKLSKAPLEHKDNLIDVITVSDDANHAALEGLLKQAKASNSEYIVFLKENDELEPVAKKLLAKNCSNSPDIVFFDEDFEDASEKHSHPSIKSPLNRQLQYTQNWIGRAFAIKTSLLKKLNLPKEASSIDLMSYSLIMQALSQDATFKYVPGVLLHKIFPESESEALTLGFKEEDIPQAQKILQAHLDAMGAHAKAEDGLLSSTLRIAPTNLNDLGKVSIIIPTMDHYKMLDRCVMSIINSATWKNYEIILVENNSIESETFDYYDSLTNKYPNIVKVVKWDGEFNYSAIVNFGAKHATGEYLLFLNNDTEVITPRFIEEMLVFTQMPKVGVVGAKLYFKDMLVQHAGMIFGPYDGISHVNQNFDDMRAGYQNRALVSCSFSGVTGACQMIRKQVFEELGGYDESFVVGFNDADICFKAISAGYDVVFTPYAELFHYEFVSRGREIVDDAKQKRWEDERDCFVEKWKDLLVDGDPISSPLFEKNSWYYALPEPENKSNEKQDT